MRHYGLHVSIPQKTGIYKETPLTAMAFFLASNQVWATPPAWSEREINRFCESLDSCPVLTSRQIVVHGCYLLNPAADREEVRDKTAIRFIDEIKLCDQLHIGRYVFHPGSTRGETQQGLDQTIQLVKLGLESGDFDRKYD